MFERLVCNDNMGKFIEKIQEFLHVLILAWIENILARLPCSESFRNMLSVLPHFIMRFNDMSPALIGKVDFVSESLICTLPSHSNFLSLFRSGRTVLSLSGTSNRFYETGSARTKVWLFTYKDATAWPQPGPAYSRSSLEYISERRPA